MNWNIEQLTRHEVSKLLSSTIVPRPIALVTTLTATNTVNAAPFSFFNVLCTEPALVALGIDGSEEADDQYKDTTRNVEATGEFVVNLVDEDLVHAMNICGVDFPSHVDETEMAGLKLTPSVQVAPPRILVSPVQFECKLNTLMPIAAGRSIIIGRIVQIHIRDDIVDSRLHIDPDRLNLVARMHGDGWYSRTRDRFQVPRVFHAEWVSSRQDKNK